MESDPAQPICYDLNRRSFVKCLAAIPALFCLRVPQQTEYDLPIGCDLTLGSLNWAFEIGKEHSLGQPRRLLIGPENRFPAREILGVPGKKYTHDSEINGLMIWDFRQYEVFLPYNTWVVEFERGRVRSVGVS